jgi:hypothetical protein
MRRSCMAVGRYGGGLRAGRRGFAGGSLLCHLVFQPRHQKLMLDLDRGGDRYPSSQPQRACHWFTAIPATRMRSMRGTSSGGTSHARVWAETVIDCSFPYESARRRRRAPRRSERTRLLLLRGLVVGLLAVALVLLRRRLGLGRSRLGGVVRALLVFPLKKPKTIFQVY